jgi:phospholipid/cholesterol/gamma-HCH transport system ATP-binding protein
MAEEKDAAQVEQELARLGAVDRKARHVGNDMTPRLLPGPGITRPPRWEAIARREAELHRKEAADA